MVFTLRRLKMKSLHRKTWLYAGALLLAAGCASTPAPTEQIAVSQAAVNDAVAAGAPEYAALELTLARDKMTAASNAVANKDYELARRLAAEAEVDARLARGKANAARAQKAANAVQEDIRVLREELNRS
jgi:hypothetical protein